MTLSNKVVLEFGGGEYAFALNGKQVEELQKLCGSPNKDGVLVPVGFGLIYQRAALGAWFHGDIYHSIRLGLEGGGMGAVEARRIADMYAVPPYLPGKIGGPEMTAQGIIKGAMHGFEDLPPGEAQAPRA